jgi:hypothetical protein
VTGQRGEAHVITVATWKSMKQAAGHAKDLEHLDRHDEARRDKKV